MAADKELVSPLGNCQQRVNERQREREILEMPQGVWPTLLPAWQVVAVHYH